MQRFLLFLFVAVMITSCQKEVHQPDAQQDYPLLKKNLLDSLPSSVYDELDFNRVARSSYPGVTLLRIGFKGKTMIESFVLVDVYESGMIKRGRIVEQVRDKTSETFNGSLLLKNLLGTIIEETTIMKGYQVNKTVLQRGQVQPAPDYVELPGVIVVSTYSTGSIYSSTVWTSLLTYYSDNSGGGSGYYSPGDPFGGSGGGYSGGGGSGGGSPNPVGIVNDELLQVDFENQHAKPAIDLEKFLKCFDNIPDAGATCKITIHTDVPVDDDPTKIMNWSTGSPGHTWIRLEKAGSGKSVSQHIGFYPKSAWKLTLTDAPVPGKFVDNGGHEFNASYEVAISPVNLRSAITRMQQLQSLQYDIDNYNCTDWALLIWKATVHSSLQLEIPQFQVPGSFVPGTSTPQGLYVKIKELNDAGVAGTSLPVIGWGGKSTGPCN